MKILAKPEFARAMAAAFVADIERNPSVRRALTDRRLDRDGLARLAIYSSNFPAIRTLIRDAADRSGVPFPPGLGQWEAIASLISTAAGAASKVYASKLESDLQKRQAQLEVQKQQTAIATAELQAKVAQAQYQAAETAARQVEQGGSGGGVSIAPGLSIPWWGIAIAGTAAAVGLGYVVVRVMSKKRRRSAS